MADKMKVIRITIFDIDNQARKLIVEFETKRDRTNFINIFEKTSDVRLNDTSEINLGINLQRSAGTSYLEDHKWEKAIEAFNVVLGSNPEDAHALDRRGIACTYGEQYLRAIADFTDSIALDDTNEGAFSNRGYCYDQLQRYDEAITDYSRAIQIRPDTTMFYANRGESYLKKKEYESAISDFSIAIELDGEMTENHNLRGEAFAQIGQYGHALADFHRELEVTPDDSMALANLNQVLQLVHENKGRE